MAQNTRQTLTATGSPSAGNVVLRITLRPGGTTQLPEDSGNVPFNCSAATLKGLLDAMFWLDPADTIVTGGPLPGTPLVIEFTGKYAGVSIPLLTVVGAFTGGGLAASLTQAGFRRSSTMVRKTISSGWERIRANGSRVPRTVVAGGHNSRRRR